MATRYSFTVRGMVRADDGAYVLQSELADLRAELETARRDAERYRWLRRRAVMMDYSDDVAIMMTLFKDEGPAGEFLDDQIDAALDAQADKEAK